MKNHVLQLSIMKLTFGLLLTIAGASTLVAAKKCPGGSCDVPEDAFCETYIEDILSDPQVGDLVVYEDIVLREFGMDNCHAGNSTKTGSLHHQIDLLNKVKHVVTAGTEVSNEVKLEAGFGPLASAEIMAGISTSISAAEGGEEATTGIDSATWNYNVPACEDHSAKVLAEWKTEHFVKVAYVRGTYERASLPPSETESVECWNVDASATGIKQYTGWRISANADEHCCS